MQPPILITAISLAITAVGCGGGVDDERTAKQPNPTATQRSEEAQTAERPVISPAEQFELVRLDRASKMGSRFDKCQRLADAIQCQGFLKGETCMQTAASERDLVDCEFSGRATVAFAKCTQDFVDEAGSGSAGDLEQCDEQEKAVLRRGKRKAAQAPDEPVIRDERELVERSFDKTVGSRFGGWNYSRCEKRREDRYLCEGSAGSKGGNWDANVSPGDEVTFVRRR